MGDGGQPVQLAGDGGTDRGVVLATGHRLGDMRRLIRQYSRGAEIFEHCRALARHWFGVAAEGLSSPELAAVSAGAGCSRQASVEFGEVLASIDDARFAPGGPDRADTNAVVLRTLAALQSIRSAVKGGEVRVIPFLPGYSTTDLVKTIIERHS